ncbi:hypothetical protein ACFQI7_15555 [Paenibacillus allorhizosphaerae]|uniref:Pectate lyase superfamily protein domain-containing protein n=1 Tax=Paenibacillus allorhizosphaerae TaxID=2849866 RepID=A0ABN7TEP5_9BACL|nr:hypothetical protein [Paenibacillus allorhizosphaerae]CAG7628742.1 hypothetical protein PAECIP111802_01489 [Paenibacillus allorhizosphaerae]
MDKTNSQDDKKTASISRREFMTALGGAGAVIAAQPLLAGTGWGASVTESTYGTGSGSESGPKYRLLYSSVAAMKADTGLTDGAYASTAGYFEPGDGGGSDYIIRTGTLTEDGGSVITLTAGMQAALLPGDRIHYKQFGAVGDGVNDDGVQIKKAHQFANDRGLPIVCESGQYWIKATNEIIIQTSVRWGQARIYIDESFNTRTNPRFRVKSRHAPITIGFDEATKAAFLSRMKPGVTIVDQLTEYKNCLVFIEDSQDRIGIRAGYAGNTGWSKEEFFYVEEHGKIVGDIAWTFSNYTKLVAYPCDESYLVIDGGTFYLSGNNPGETYQGYFYNGFQVERSRTIIRNQWVGLAPGQADVSMNPRNGFYQFSRVFDVLLENVRLIPWEKDREGTARDVAQGTYGIGGSRTLNATFRNVTAEGSWVHWGVFGTNLFKNFHIENCRLNRVDVHFHCWNLYVKDSEIGYKGFTLTGGGDLFIENTRRFGNQFISFRQDYGAKWDGHIRLRSCRLMVENGATDALALDFNPQNFDYKYPIGYGRTIRVEDFTFDYTGLAALTGKAQVMRIASFSKITSSGARVFFPYQLEFRNIGVSGREKGVRLLQIPNPYSLHLGRPGGMDGQRVKANCYMRFENIHGEKVPAQASQASTHVNFLINALNTGVYEDEYALYPKIDFVQVGDFFGHFKGGIADVCISRSVVNCMDAYEGGPMRGRIQLDQCDIKADALDDGKSLYYLSTELGTYFVNCTVHAPVLDGVARPDLLARYDFIDVNNRLRYYHMNTKLSKELTDYFVNSGNPVEPEFYAMLRSRHGEDSELMARRKGTTAQRPQPASFRSEKGFVYFDTDIRQIVVWDGAGWVPAAGTQETLHFYTDHVAGAASTVMKRAENHPAQVYFLSQSGQLSSYAAYFSAPAGTASFTFELWKNDALWIGGISGPSASVNPLIAAFTGNRSFNAGDRIAVRIADFASGLPANAYATLDVNISYTGV